MNYRYLKGTGIQLSQVTLGSSTFGDQLDQEGSFQILSAALEAGINYHEFRYREADFGSYPKGLMYGLQMMDSWLYDENEPFMHIDALDTFAFLKKQVGTGYYEELIRKYLLDNTHGAIVVVKPEKGRTARMDRELEEKLEALKDSLSDARKERLVEPKSWRTTSPSPTGRRILRRSPCCSGRIFPGRSRPSSTRR